jgi:acetylornithine deacetylase
MPMAPDTLASDTAALVQVPSPTGDERAALERLGELADAVGLEAGLHRHDLDSLRADPGHPGEEAPRDELWSLAVTAPAPGGAPRLCLCGHVDVVGPGTEQWAHGPWSGRVDDGFVHGRGSVDMKGGVVAALHAMAATAGRSDVEVVLLAVASEEDGGLGAFAALREDDSFDACLIPEPTELDVVCAQAGALTFEGVVHGRGAHAAARLEGRSAIDEYVRVHAALAAHEERINAGVEHPLMTGLALPYPISVGRIAGGEWSSSVPDRLEFQGRLGVRVGEDPADAEAGLYEALEGLPVDLRFTGGRYASADTPVDHPFARHVVDAFPGARAVGVPYGADMRHFIAHGIPTVMAGPRGLARAHAVDERVAVADLVATAQGITRVIEGFGPVAGGVSGVGRTLSP